MNQNLSFRYATEEDVEEIIRLIKELAEYQKAGESVSATPELIKRALFEEKAVEALLVDHNIDGVVGFAVFYQTFSTWEGKCGMYLEDLYIEERHRGLGTGRALMAELAQLCEERGLTRFDWSCLAWNTSSLGFYKSIGAKQINDWIHHRLSGDELQDLAKESTGEGL